MDLQVRVGERMVVAHIPLNAIFQPARSTKVFYKRANPDHNLNGEGHALYRVYRKEDQGGNYWELDSKKTSFLHSAQYLLDDYKVVALVDLNPVKAEGSILILKEI